jgi:hypothetical protein
MSVGESESNEDRVASFAAPADVCASRVEAPEIWFAIWQTVRAAFLLVPEGSHFLPRQSFPRILCHTGQVMTRGDHDRQFKIAE